MIRRPARSEDTSDEDEKYTTRRTASTEAPVRRSRAVEDDDEDVEEPKIRRVIRRGWAGAEAVKTAGSNFAQSLKLSEESQIIKFLEDEPYAAYRQHWVERQGQKSWICIEDMDAKGCPLCEVGNRASQRFSFNVALLMPGSDPIIKSYDVGPRVIDQLKNFHTDSRQGPLTKHYWAVSRTGKGTTSATNHQMVRERDLPDFDIEPISEVDLRSLTKQAYTEDILSIPTRKELLSIAEELE
jgi:hypothetical protein